MLKIEDAISETLLIPLYMKHLASQQPDPIIKDEAAERIVSELDYNFSKFDNVIHTVIGTAIRADYFDRLAADFIKRQPNPVIVNVGCGLDSRRERIGEIAQNVPFYSLDLPDVMTLRIKLLPPQNGEVFLGTSAFDAGWMASHSDQHEALKHSRARFVFGCDDDHEPERWAHNLHLVSAKRLMTDFPAWKKSGVLSAMITRRLPFLKESFRMLHYRID